MLPSLGKRRILPACTSDTFSLASNFVTIPEQLCALDVDNAGIQRATQGAELANATILLACRRRQAARSQSRKLIASRLTGL